MKIAINTTSAVYGGGVTYLNQFLEHLSKIDAINDYYIFTADFSTHKFNSIENKNWKYFRFRFLKRPLLRILWEQFILPIYLKKEKIDVLYSPANVLPLFLNCKMVVMIQNMAPFYQELQSKQNFYYEVRFFALKLFSILAIKRADALIFISEYARRALNQQYGFDSRKSFLIYHGRDDRFNIQATASDEVSKDFGIRNKYILFVSNLYKHKNALELIKAYAIVESKIRDYQLVIAGEFSEKKYYQQMLKEIKINTFKNDILLLGSVAHKDLPRLYQGASLFVFPSSCENCPNIIIEAMSSGLPIVCSDRMSMPEICQDAAIYFDPGDPKDIAGKILAVLQDDALRQELKKKALGRSQDFSWDKTTRKTLEVFEKVYNS